jgi:hypothetical protein
MLPVCPHPPLVTFEPNGNFHKIHQGGHTVDSELGAIFFKFHSFKHSKMAEFQTSEVDSKLEPVNLGP